VPSEPSLDALLARDDVDAVAITTPQETHAEFAIAAARAGKHLFVEKPMSLTVAEADAMMEAAAAARVALAVVSQHRFRPTPLAARAAIVRGDLGTLRMVEARGAMAWPGYRRDRAPWVELGAHLCDLLRWLVGGEPVDVSARVATFGAPAESPQTVMATFAFASGVLARVWLTFELPDPGLGSQVEFTIVGSEGMLELDSYAVARLGTKVGWRVLAEQPHGNPDDPFDPVRLQSYADQLRDFVAAVATVREPTVDGLAGRTTMAMLEAAIRSDRERRTIEIAPAPTRRGATRPGSRS
jgi:predicted dehydrogenase